METRKHSVARSRAAGLRPRAVGPRAFRAGGGSFPPLPAPGSRPPCGLCLRPHPSLPVLTWSPHTDTRRRAGAALFLCATSCLEPPAKTLSHLQGRGDTNGGPSDPACCLTRPCCGPSPHTRHPHAPALHTHCPHSCKLMLYSSIDFPRIPGLPIMPLTLLYGFMVTDPLSCGIWPGSPPRRLAAVPVTVGHRGQPHPACTSVPIACGPPSQRLGWLRPHVASSLCPAVSAAPCLAHTPSESTLASRACALRLVLSPRVGTLGAWGPCVLGKPSAVLPLRRCQGRSVSCGPQPGAPTASCSPNRWRHCWGSLPLSPRRRHAILLNTELRVSRAALPRSLLSTRARPAARRTRVRGPGPDPALTDGDGKRQSPHTLGRSGPAARL